MSEDGALKASGVGSLSDSRGKENESARDQFDAAWRVGRQPSIERYLQTCQESHREALFRDLLEIEIEYRRRAGDTMNSADYHERFPDFIAVIDQILDDPGLPRPVEMETTADALPTTGEAVGITLGRYKLLQELGTGGFGVVYLAEQQKPVRRRVALKIIKLGMDTKQVVARFEAERQALALMDHPHIATVLDAGATHTGRPYFVMELVKGIPITKYCDEHNVSLNDRLKLFLQVCAAVQHAHQKGIIHRDLKPSNVLVELVDNRPSPKVIDFGIAKATDQRLTEQTMYTELGQFIGTPAYMSPEQTEVQVLDIDTRSDIYSLGVLLYELLTGTTPFDIQKMAGEGAGFDAIKKVIRDVEPSKPSTKLSTLGKDVTTVAKRRGMEPSKLTSILRGDLDWIVMKALEKDRGRRYETASAFSEDVRRFLANEVIEARPPSRRYRLAKYVRRNKGVITTLAVVFTLLIAGISGTTTGWIRSWRQEGISAELAQRNQNVVDAFVHAFKSANPLEVGATSDMTALQVLQQALANLTKDQDLQGIPLTKATLLEAIGSSLSGLGAYDEAIPALRTSRQLTADERGPDHPDTLHRSSLLSQTYTTAGKHREAIELLEYVLPRQRAALGGTHAHTLDTLDRLAFAYQESGDLDMAIDLFADVLQQTQSTFGADHPRSATALARLAECHRHAGQAADAAQMLEEALPRLVRAKGDEDPLVMSFKNNLALAYVDAGRATDALPLLHAVLRSTESRFGTDHNETQATKNNLAMNYAALGRFAEALPLFESAKDGLAKAFGPTHPKTLLLTNNLAHCYLMCNRASDATPILEANLQHTVAQLGEDHPQSIGAMNNLAAAFYEAGRLEKARPLYEESNRLLQEVLGPEHPFYLESLTNLAGLYAVLGRLSDAIPLYERALGRSDAVQGPKHPHQQGSMYRFAEALLQNRDFARAQVLATEYMQGLDDLHYSYASNLANANITLAEALVGQGQTTEARAKLKLAVDADELHTVQQLRAQSLEGAVLTAEQTWEKAEPLLVESFEQLEQQRPDLHPRQVWIVLRGCERVATLYETWGKQDESKAWTQRCDRLREEIREGWGPGEGSSDP